MQKILTHKLPGGKFFRINLDYNRFIDSIQITGDFFAHPEDCIEQMELILKGKPVSISKEALQNMLDQYIQTNNVMLVGLTSEAIAQLIHGGITNGS